jgi:signal transduction histidine kinase
MATVPVGWIALSTAAYLGVAMGLLALTGRSRRIAIPALQGGLLLDGIYLAWLAGLTGGATSLLRFLPYIHVVGVILLCSYRTGLKLALWHTMLFLLVTQAVEAGLIPGTVPTTSHTSAIALTVAGLWLLALGTAAFSAASERELRRQKADLSHLSAMVARIDASGVADGPNGISHILLDELCATFGFVRGVVLASPEGDLALLAATETLETTAHPVEMDPLMSKAWSERAPQLVRQVDAGTDPWLARLLPGAHNMMVVPLFLVGGQRLGIVAVERAGRSTAMPRWEVEMVGQFTAHAALALYNTWLAEERERQLRTIKELETRLRAHNVELEARVAERTQELHQLIRDLEETDWQRRRLLDHVVTAAEDERRRIAHDIHDDPVQKLAAAKMLLEMLADRHPDLDDLERVREVLATTIQSMRTMLFDLSPPILDEEGIGPALRYFLENSPIESRWSLEDDLAIQPSSQTRLILYRTAQEALSNARKHAKADNVRVRLQGRDGGVWMEIEDDGVGFDPQNVTVSAPGHLGLAALRERAEMAGGWCTLRSLTGAGTSLEVWLPDTPDTPDASDSTDELAPVLPLHDRMSSSRPARTG